MQMTYRLTLSCLGVLLCTHTAQAANGLPDNYVNVELENSLTSTISTALPESTAVDPDFLDPSYNPVLRLNQDAQIGVTFIDEGAGYRNSLGYFTFNDNAFDGINFGSIDSDSSGNISLNELSTLGGISTGMIFDNVSKAGSGGGLLAGDTVVLGGGTATASGTDFTMEGGEVFSNGTNVGFFLLQNAWTGSGVKSIDQPGDPLTLYSVDFLNPENDAFATYDSADDYSRHVAMMFSDQSQDELILGFEDLNRTDNTANDYNYTSDEDFNDAIFRIRTNPEAALSETNVSVANSELLSAPAPSLGAGLLGLFGMGGLLAFGYRKDGGNHEGPA